MFRLKESCWRLAERREELRGVEGGKAEERGRVEEEGWREEMDGSREEEEVSREKEGEREERGSGEEGGREEEEGEVEGEFGLMLLKRNGKRGDGGTREEEAEGRKKERRRLNINGFFANNKKALTNFFISKILIIFIWQMNIEKKWLLIIKIIISFSSYIFPVLYLN